jgi:hypothetical protein
VLFLAKAFEIKLHTALYSHENQFYVMHIFIQVNQTISQKLYSRYCFCNFQSLLWDRLLKLCESELYHIIINGHPLFHLYIPTEQKEYITTVRSHSSKTIVELISAFKRKSYCLCDISQKETDPFQVHIINKFVNVRISIKLECV